MSIILEVFPNSDSLDFFKNYNGISPVLVHYLFILCKPDIRPAG